MQPPLTKRDQFRTIIILFLLAFAGCNSETDPVLEETFEQVCKIEPNADINIQNSDGAILVYGSNTNEMQVHATKKAYSRARLNLIAIDVSVGPNSVSINVKMPAKPSWALFDRSGTVDCTIVVPATANISSLRLNAGEVLLDGMRGGTLHAWLGDGRMIAHNCFADVDLALQRGNLSLSYDWWEDEKFSLLADVSHGNVWAFLPSNAAFHLFAETGHGKLGNDFDDPAIARPTFAKAQEIDMLVRGGSQTLIKLRTAKGDIKIIEANL